VSIRVVYVKMARGPKKHLKRLAAPRHWMLDKLSGTWAPRPSTGPHKLRECLPVILLLRNRLKYALTRREVLSIVMQRHIKVDGKLRTDPNYPAGFMDVIQIDKTGETYRLLYDTKGRFVVHTIPAEEAKYKLCKIKGVKVGPKGIPYMTTHDARTFRYPDPQLAPGDTVKVDLTTGKVEDLVKFDLGNLVMVTGGANQGRVGVVESKEKHPGSYDVVHVKDAVGNKFSTRATNVFVIGKGTTSLVSLPKQKGIKLSIVQEREKRLSKQGEKKATA